MGKDTIRAKAKGKANQGIRVEAPVKTKGRYHASPFLQLIAKMERIVHNYMHKKEKAKSTTPNNDPLEVNVCVLISPGTGALV